MSKFRLLAAALALLFVALPLAGPSFAQQHWLIGSWKGALSGVPSGSLYGTDRTLTVSSVAADGSASGVWTGPSAKQPVKLTVNGDTVTFITPGSTGASYKLMHKGNALEGSWQNSGNGKGGAVSLTKQ